MAFDPWKYLAKTTEVFLSTPETLFGVDGARPFLCVDDKPVPAKDYDPSPLLNLFFQVTSCAEGSWWVPAASECQPEWEKLKGGCAELIGNGLIPKNLVRPRYLFWWVPGPLPQEMFVPTTLAGTIAGEHPEGAPLTLL